MTFHQASNTRGTSGWRIVSELTAADGSAGHPMPLLLVGARVAIRDVADAVHILSMLHGHHPGVIDHAIDHNRQPAATRWLEQAAEGFAVERAFLAQLTAASGPLPSTPGQAESEAAITAQRHALDMLAQSDRTGCATGCAIALVLDWATIRTTLDAAAERLGVEAPAAILPTEAETAAMTDALGENPAIERAMAFGAQQLLAQHRGLWDLLEARASARDRR